MVTNSHPNDGCTKCIINARLVAINADVLAKSLHSSHTLVKPAEALVRAGDALVDTYLWLRSMNALPDRTADMTPEQWTGCDDAAAVVKIIESRNSESFTIDDARAELERLHAGIVQSIGALVGGESQ